MESPQMTKETIRPNYESDDSKHAGNRQGKDEPMAHTYDADLEFNLKPEQRQQLMQRLIAEGPGWHNEIQFEPAHDHGIDWLDVRLPDKVVYGRINELREPWKLPRKLEEPDYIHPIGPFTFKTQKTTGDVNYNYRAVDEQTGAVLFINFPMADSHNRHWDIKVRLPGTTCGLIRRRSERPTQPFREILEQISLSLTGKRYQWDVPNRFDLFSDHISNRPLTKRDTGYDPALPDDHVEEGQFDRIATHRSCYFKADTFYAGKRESGAEFKIYNKCREKPEYAINIEHLPIIERLLLAHSAEQHHHYNPEKLITTRTVMRVEHSIYKQWVSNNTRCQSFDDWAALVDSGEIWRTLNSEVRFIEGRDSNTTRDESSPWWKTVEASWQRPNQPPMPKVDRPKGDWQRAARDVAQAWGRLIAEVETTTGLEIDRNSVPLILANIATQITQSNPPSNPHAARYFDMSGESFKKRRDAIVTAVIRTQQWLDWHAFCNGVGRITEACTETLAHTISGLTLTG